MGDMRFKTQEARSESQDLEKSDIKGSIPTSKMKILQNITIFQFSNFRIFQSPHPHRKQKHHQKADQR